MRLRAFFGRIFGSAIGRGVVSDATDYSSAQDHILKLRFYSDGQLTLNGNVVDFAVLHDAAKSASSNGGAVWVWWETGMTEVGGNLLGKLLEGVNLRIAFGSEEDFSRMPLPEYGVDAKPSNAMLFNSDEEFQQYAGNETEFYVYLNNLQLRFDIYGAEKLGAGIFHIVGAVRPNASKFWFLHPGVHGDEHYQPLLESLESQPLPTVKRGVLAFLISNKRPLEPGEFPQFDIVAPDAWTDVPKSLGKDMSVCEILDVVWPGEPSR